MNAGRGTRPAVDEAVLSAWLAAAQVRPGGAPGWMTDLVHGLENLQAGDLSRNDPPANSVAYRQAAVLVLLGHAEGSADRGDTGEADVLLQVRADGLRDHPSQVSFPGGGWEPGDTSPVETALREAVEETGLDPAGVDPVALLPRLLIPPSGFQVTGVVAHWRRPSPVTAVDSAENAAVMRVPLARLADPSTRLTVTNGTGWTGPAFLLGPSVIWGYTAEVLAAVLRLGGWELPWAPGPPRELDRVWAEVRRA